MTEADKREFAEIFGAVWAIYGKGVSSQLLSIAFESLRAYSIDEVRIGLTKHIQSPDSGQFFPKPADIIKHIDGDAGSRAMMAWTKVDKAIRQVGIWTSVVFDDAYIHRVISDMGGWVALCKIDERAYPFKLKEFVNRYESYLSRGEVIDHPKCLKGLAANHNQDKQSDIEEPVVVGDRVKAAQVYKKGIGDFTAIPLGKLGQQALQSLLEKQSEGDNEKN